MLQLLEKPFDHAWVEEAAGGGCSATEGAEAGKEEDALARYRGKPTPKWAAELVCTCSS